MSMSRCSLVGFAVTSLLVATVLTGCDNSSSSEVTQASQNANSGSGSIEVTTGDIVPTLSLKAEVQQKPAFTLTLAERGSFKSAVKPGQVVKAGAVVGWTGGKEITTPVEATITQVAESSDELPANYAVLGYEYRGFGITVPVGSLLRHAQVADLSGKFQITDGVGPTDCLAVVTAGASGTESSDLQATQDNSANQSANATGQEPKTIHPANYSSEDSQADADKGSAGNSAPNVSSEPIASHDQAVCLIAKDVDVSAGQQANLVISANRREGVLTLPVSAVAGRLTQGKVTKLVGGKEEVTSVQLGATDGAKIEIVAGLQAGDHVSLEAPNLDPRNK